MKKIQIQCALLFLLLVGTLSCNNIQMLPDGAAFPQDYKDQTGDFLRIMTWNVEHFVDEYNDPYVNHKREDYPEEMSEKKIELFKEALVAADADIIVFQEFESAAFLEQFSKKHFPELNYQFFADSRSSTWYMNVVIMSRVPLGTMHGYGNIYTPAVYEDEAGRKQKETQNKINSRMWSCEIWPTTQSAFILTGLHLKAGGKNRDVATRLGQIEFLNHQHDRFMAESKHTKMIILGDLNAYPDSRELTRIKTGTRHTQFEDLLSDSIHTHTADNPSRRLDYILVNDNMKRVYKEESVTVPYFFKPDKMRIISDHLPVYADFYFKR